MSSLSDIQSLELKAQSIVDDYKTTYSSLDPLSIPSTIDYAYNRMFSDQHKVFFDELEKNPACTDQALEDLQKYKDTEPDFLEVMVLSVEIANRKFLDEIQDRSPKDNDSPNYNYFTNLLFQDENQNYISIGFNIDYSASYFRDNNFFFYDKIAEKQRYLCPNCSLQFTRIKLLGKPKS